MRMTAKVEVNLRTREVQERGVEFAWAFAEQLGALAQKYAILNVTPGKGPGPHPHRPPPFPEHWDTGKLARSIMTRRVEQGFLKTVQVYTDVGYGTFLEVGWVSPAGNFWRYPWLEPAAKLANQHMAEIARSTSRAFFTGGYTGRRVNLIMRSFATFKPGIPEGL